MSDVTDQTITDFMQLRKTKKAPLTQRAIEGIRNEAMKAGISLENALIECCTRGWAGFKAEWYKQSQVPAARASPNKADALLRNNRESVKDWVPLEMRKEK